MNRRIQMRKINVFAAALILIGLGAWVVTTNSRVAASTPVGIDPLQRMTGATNLPPSHYVDYGEKGWRQASFVQDDRSPGGGSAMLHALDLTRSFQAAKTPWQGSKQERQRSD